MSTPDTEWEKEIRFNPRAGGKGILTDRMIIEEVRKGDNYVVWKSPKTTVHIIPESKLQEMLSSRDTYWKERVQKALKTVAYREVTVRGGMYSDDKYRGPNEEVIRLVKMQDVELVLGITNEDNLK